MCNLNIALKGSSMINMFNVSLGSTHTLFCEHNNTRIEDITVKYFVHYVLSCFSPLCGNCSCMTSLDRASPSFFGK